MVVADPNLIKEIKNHSTKDFNISACFNCGNCTAICPLSTEENQFPRSMIRYANVGLKDKLLSEKKLWICSACNECSDTCPRNATPGEFMNAARKWAISQYDVSGISKLLFKNKWIFRLSTVIIAILIAAMFLVTANFDYFTDERQIVFFDLHNEGFIRNSSLILVGILGIIILLSFLNLIIKILHAENSSIKEGLSQAKQNKKSTTIYSLVFSPVVLVIEAIKVGLFEVLGQKKQYECLEENPPKNLWDKLTSKWVMHIFTIWGFIGLFIATAMDVLFKSENEYNTLVTFNSIFIIVRILGIISGIFFIIGVTGFILKRLFKVNKYYSNSTFEDYFILILLWIIGVTGVSLDFFLYLDFLPAKFAYIFFIIHLTAFYELMIYAPFTKFAHIWYRTFALWLSYGIEKRKLMVSA